MAQCIVAKTIRVPADHSTIQAAIGDASNGDEVEVAPGTYRERIDFKGKNIWVRSATGPETTILDGNFGGPVVTFANSEGAGAIIDGFTIQKGGGPAVSMRVEASPSRVRRQSFGTTSSRTTNLVTPAAALASASAAQR
jgi:hypothetical protein